MNFIEAMQHVAENERTAVILPGADSFVWYDGAVRRRGQPPAGLLIQRIGRGQSSQPYAPTLKEVLSEDWETYQPGNLMRL
jgi:hypothetical protein